MKKTMMSMLIIIIILAIIFGIKVINSNKTSNAKYSRADVITLIENGKNYNNYYCEYTKLDEHIIRKIKDNKMVVISNNMTVYTNYETNKQTIIQNNIAIVSNLSNSKLSSLNKTYFADIDLINDSNYNYKYIKEENINGIDCIKIELTSDSIKYEIWISTSSGLPTKMIYSTSASNVSTDFNLKLDCVTDSDVETPNLNNYTVKEM